MKTAVSIPDELYARADEAARRLGLNRSQLYARALVDLLDSLGPDPVTLRLDALAHEFGDGVAVPLGSLPRSSVAPLVDRVDAVAGRRLVESGAWEW